MPLLAPETSRPAPAPPPAPARRALVLGLLYGLALVPLAAAPRHSGNVWSRYMTIESIVERGTLAVERSPLRAISGSPDLIRSGRHLYSDKPPLLAALGALVYAPAHHLGGLRMAGSPSQFARMNLLLVSAFAVAGSALAVAGMRLLLALAPLSPWAADAMAMLGGVATLLLSYAVTFNNHSVAAGLITMALALATLDRPAAPVKARRRDLIVGLCAGLALTIDLPAGATVAAAIGLWSTVERRRFPLFYAVGMAGPVLVHALLQVATTGSPLPAELTPAVFDYPGSYWNTPEGRWVEPGPRWRFGVEFLVGPQGWLTVTPALVAGMVAIPILASRRGGDRVGPLARVVGGTVLVLVVYYVFGVRRTDFAGMSFGTRHLLAITPAVWALGVIGLARLRRPLAWGLFGAAVAIGTVYAVAGMRDPWSRIERRDDGGLRLVKRLTISPRSSYRR
jgi:hypothetical protein